MNKIFLAIFLISLYSHLLFAQAGINPASNPPDASAGLDVSFTDKGFLPPRVALTAINAASPVNAPAAGLLVYNTATAGVSPNHVVPGCYYWSGTKWIAVSPSPGTHAGDMRYWDGAQWIMLPAGTAGQVLTFNYGIPVWGKIPVACGTSFTVFHTAGTVAPVDKTVTYATVSNVPGETSKCWITRNLGASQQATALNDASEASAGWYWQFNRKQGYKHDGTTRTPASTWIMSIDESSNWLLANDPCALEIGLGWRIPTSTEWTNVDAAGNWTNANGPWGSVLKLHYAGNLTSDIGSLINRGAYGDYWSSTQSSNTNGWLIFFSPSSCAVYSGVKAYGFPVRCVRDY